jgi:hypothetical protein
MFVKYPFVLTPAVAGGVWNTWQVTVVACHGAEFICEAMTAPSQKTARRRSFALERQSELGALSSHSPAY